MNYLDLVQRERDLQIGRFGPSAPSYSSQQAPNHYASRPATQEGSSIYQSAQSFSTAGYTNGSNFRQYEQTNQGYGRNQPVRAFENYGGYAAVSRSPFREQLPFDYTQADRRSTYIEPSASSYRVPAYQTRENNGLSSPYAAANSYLYTTPPPPPPLPAMTPTSQIDRPNVDGLGVTLQGLPDGLARIAEVKPGSPAAVSKDIHPGDVLMTIDGMDVRKLTLAQCGAMLSGPRGSSVQLGIFRYVNVVRGPTVVSGAPNATQSPLAIAPLNLGSDNSSFVSGKKKKEEKSEKVPPQLVTRKVAIENKAAPVRQTQVIPSAKAASANYVPPEFVRDPKGEAEIARIANEARYSGKQFEDPQFGAVPSSLVPSGGQLGQDVAQALAQATDVSKIMWLRPEQIPPAGPGDVFVDGTEPDDIVQGELGTCYFLAALSACASNDALIEDLIVEDHRDAGIYGVKFFYQGAWHTVSVDSRIPCRARDGKPWSCSWNPNNPKELWAMICEKGWAKLHTSYTNCDGGQPSDTMVYLTGGFKLNFDWPADATQTQTDKIWTEVSGMFAGHNESPVYVSASISLAKSKTLANMSHDEVQKKFGLGGDHAYTILDMKQIPSGDRLVKVRNPWGEVEWIGEWDDNDSRWTPELRNLMKMPHGAVNDGTYCIEWSTFVKFFTQIGVVKCFGKNMVQKIGRGTFATDVAGTPSQSKSVFRLSNMRDRRVHLQVEQRDVRELKFKGKPQHRAVTMAITNASGALVKQSEFAVSRLVSFELDLDPAAGPYNINVYSQPFGTSHPDNSFWLSAWSHADFSLENPTDPNAIIKH